MEDKKSLLDRTTRKTSEEGIKEVNGNLAREILLCAVNCGGIAFGGFVRDWIVRQRSFKDLDLWFKTRKEATRFIADLFDFACANSKRNMVIKKNLYDNKVASKPWAFEDTDGKCYGLERMKLAVVCDFLDEEEMATCDHSDLNIPHAQVEVDIIVSPTFPTNDFDVNALTYDGKNMACGLDGEDDEKNLDSIVEKIKAGKASMLPHYIKLIESENVYMGHYQRVKNFIYRNVFEIDNFDCYSCPAYTKVIYGDRNYGKKRKINEGENKNIDEGEGKNVDEGEGKNINTEENKDIKSLPLSLSDSRPKLTKGLAVLESDVYKAAEFLEDLARDLKAILIANPEARPFTRDTFLAYLTDQWSKSE